MTSTIPLQSAELGYAPYDDLARSLITNLQVGGNDQIGVGLVIDPSNQGVKSVNYFDSRLRSDVGSVRIIGKRTLRDHVVAFTEMMGAEKPDGSDLWDLQVSIVTTMLAKKISDTRARALCGELRTLSTTEENE